MTEIFLDVDDGGFRTTVQDLGRPGFQRNGVAEGGAVDPVAVWEGAALLGQPPELAALEMVGLGGRYRAFGGAVRVALTGAPFAAERGGGRAAPWRGSFVLEDGEVLTIGGALTGGYGYLHVGGGVDVAPVLRSLSTHLRAGFGGFGGRALRKGDRLIVGVDDGQPGELELSDLPNDPPNRIRVLWGVQAEEFSAAERERFLASTFEVTPQRDRMGVRLAHDGEPFVTERSLTLISDAVVLGDVQVPGDGRAVVLLADRQPTGGYPRIATVISADLAAFAQLPPGAAFHFVAVDHATAVSALRVHQARLDTLTERVRPRLPQGADLERRLSTTNLVDGVTTGGLTGP
ncbi:MAG: urea amidolyase [Pseudomonadota bacterium]